MLTKRNYSPEELTALLQEHGINPTGQRLEIARLLFARAEHLSADDVFVLVNKTVTKVSKATVYNTLGLFAEHGLIRAVIADPNKVFYDPNTAAHYHFYDVASGRLTDIDADGVRISGLPPPPDDARMEGVDVIIRLRRGDRPVH